MPDEVFPEVELLARVPADVKEHVEFIARRIGEPVDAVVVRALDTYLYGKGIYFNALAEYAHERQGGGPDAS